MRDLVPTQVFSKRLRPYLRSNYSGAQLRELRTLLAPALAIQVNGSGIVSAASRKLEGPESEGDETHYDAVWLRDSIWVALGLRTETETRKHSIHVLKAMLSYLSTPPQLARMHKEEVIHIRFDGKSEKFEDVLMEGKPQHWNHKQNDALGLFYLDVLDAIAAGDIHETELVAAEWEVLLHLPLYFGAIRFTEVEDAGPWEEIDRLNTSSVALVTAGLERLDSMLASEKRRDRWLSKAAELKLDKAAKFLKERTYKELLELGYERVLKQMTLGESPIYPVDSQKYRMADAALLNVIYPARLARLGLEQKLAILKLVEPLVREVGVCRYLHDSYQAAGYWKSQSADDCSSSEKFAARSESLVPGTEAQWFFDSWLSKIWGLLYAEYGQAEFLEKQSWHFNRGLAQLTEGDAGTSVQGADGKQVFAFAFPESYNVVLGKNGAKEFLPSPITPLNWAKASNLLAFEQMFLSLG